MMRYFGVVIGSVPIACYVKEVDCAWKSPSKMTVVSLNLFLLFAWPSPQVECTSMCRCVERRRCS